MSGSPSTDGERYTRWAPDTHLPLTRRRELRRHHETGRVRRELVFLLVDYRLIQLEQGEDIRMFRHRAVERLVAREPFGFVLLNEQSLKRIVELATFPGRVGLFRVERRP